MLRGDDDVEEDAGFGRQRLPEGIEEGGGEDLGGGFAWGAWRLGLAARYEATGLVGGEGDADEGVAGDLFYVHLQGPFLC